MPETRENPLPSSGQSLTLDILTQVQDIALKINNGDQTHLLLLSRLDKIETSICNVPHMIYRLEQMEKRQDELKDETRSNTEFRIRMEAGIITRRWGLGVLGGMSGGTLAALLVWLFGRPH